MGPMTLRAPPTHCTLAQHVDSSSQRACRHLEARGPQCSEGPAQVTQWSCKAGRVCCFLGHAGLAGYVRGRCSLGCTSSQAAPPAGTGWRRGAIQWACCFVGPRAGNGGRLGKQRDDRRVGPAAGTVPCSGRGLDGCSLTGSAAPPPRSPWAWGPMTPRSLRLHGPTPPPVPCARRRWQGLDQATRARHAMELQGRPHREPRESCGLAQHRTSARHLEGLTHCGREQRNDARPPRTAKSQDRPRLAPDCERSEGLNGGRG